MNKQTLQAINDLLQDIEKRQLLAKSSFDELSQYPKGLQENAKGKAYGKYIAYSHVNKKLKEIFINI